MEGKKMFVTELIALDPRDNEQKTWVGPNVPGESIEDAQKYCEENGLGYLNIKGEVG